MRADRLLSLLMLLQTRGRVTARQLAYELEVSERTIYRDLDALSATGVPVYAERGPGGGCALLDHYRTSLTGLTENEVRALFMLSIPGPLADLGVSQELKGALLKLSASLPENQRRDIESVRQRIHLDAAGWFQPDESVPHLTSIQQAVWQDRRLVTKYRRGDGSCSERLIDPYGLVAKAGIWYLVRAVKGRVGVYRVSRVQDATLTDERFERPDGFDLVAFWEKWSTDFETTRPVYPVMLRVSPAILHDLPFVLGERVRTQIEQLDSPDDEGWLTLPFTFEHMETARRVALGFGSMLEVLEPQELRESVIEYANNIVVFYAQQRSD